MNHSSSTLTMVSRMLVGELNSRVRRKPTKPVVLIGAARSANESWRTKAEAADIAHQPMLRPIRQP